MIVFSATGTQRRYATLPAAGSDRMGAGGADGDFQRICAGLAGQPRIGGVKRLLQSGAIVSAGLAVEYAAQMLRVLILARLLGPVEFGVVVSLNALWALVQMSTFVGVDRYLIHAPDGARRRVLAASHTLTLGSGVLAALLILVLAWPTAWILGVPHALGSFMALALVPLLRGLMHMRFQQLQRRHVFWPEAAATTAANLGGLAATAAAALLLRDHRAIVWGLCATAALNAAASHLLTRVPYRISVSGPDLRCALGFGLPLTLNGFALAMLGQLDRMVVGAMLGVADLGRYGAAMTLVFTPISLLFRVGTSVSQPHLSAAWSSQRPSAVKDLFRRMASGFAILSLPFAVGVAALGDPVMQWLFGTRYAVGDIFMGLLSFGVLGRCTKATANLGGLAIGRTTDLMLSNVAGAIGLAVTAGALLVQPNLSMAAAGNVAGEALATGFVVIRLDQFLRERSSTSPYRPFFAALPALALVVLWVLIGGPSIAARVILVAALLPVALTAGWRLSLSIGRRQPGPI